jgi:hypothetical protein
MALWTLVEQQAIKPLNSNNTGLFAQLQTEVECNDLVKYLGFEFYQDLKRNPTTYTTLLAGGTYTVNGVTYTFDGLKHVCAYLLYARYVEQSYIQDTFSGFVQHTGENFRQISGAEMKNRAAAFREIAGTLWDECKNYLYTLSLYYFPIRENPTIDYV